MSFEFPSLPPPPPGGWVGLGREGGGDGACPWPHSWSRRPHAASRDKTFFTTGVHRGWPCPPAAQLPKKVQRLPSAPPPPPASFLLGLDRVYLV